jgi:hypothetical protein
VNEALRTSTPIAVATLRRVTPAQPSSACSSMSPEQASDPSPPVVGCRPARTGPAQVSTVAVTPGSVHAARASIGAHAASGSSR